MKASALSPGAWRQIGAITAAAALVLAALWLLPAGPRLTHMDFVVGGPAALEFCDPVNPRFLPVVARSSPVTMVLSPAMPVAGAAEAMTLSLRTATGKPLGPGDLLPTATHRINLLLVDPSLQDFQALAAAPGARAGEWRFAFTPRRGGNYRIFADFTPAATGQEMYASADQEVMPSDDAPGRRPGPRAGAATSGLSVERDGYRLTLRPSGPSIVAREPVALTFTAESLDGGPAAWEPLDGGFATLVAFDLNRTGFVNLRAGVAGRDPSGGAAPLVFTVAIPDPGPYVIWSRVKIGGRVITAPFRIQVAP